MPEPSLDLYPDGDVGFAIRGALPGSGVPKPAEIGLTEIWARQGEHYERISYAYELIDHERDRRRAFHMHDRAAFLKLGVVVHEHCEEQLGHAECRHFFGLPVATGHDGLERLLIAWTEAGPLGCADLRCMDPVGLDHTAR